MNFQWYKVPFVFSMDSLMHVIIESFEIGKLKSTLYKLVPKNQVGNYGLTYC